VFAALMLMNFISTSISYKKREIGVLRALGARGSDIFGIFFNESMIIAMINFVLSAIATVITCTIINNVLLAKLPVEVVLLNVGIRQVILIFGVSVIAAFVGSFLPTFKISRKKPIDAINNR
jgi:ABC-type antimicrobial peptide transport system permease subunit